MHHMAITEINIDEEDDEISFVVRGSFSEADAVVYADGKRFGLAANQCLMTERDSLYLLRPFLWVIT